MIIRGIGAQRERLLDDGIAPHRLLPCPCCGLMLALFPGYSGGVVWVDHPDPPCRWYVETPAAEVDAVVEQHAGLPLSRHGGAA